MKVFFSATPSRIQEYRKNYQLIGKIIESLGHQHTTRWILDFKDEWLDALPRDLWKAHYREIVAGVAVADLAVLDISVSSTSIGQVIQQAMVWKKPVIALRDHKGKPNIFLEGAGDVESKLLVVEYTLETLEKELKQAFKYMEDWLETRFTLILGGKIRHHLDKIAGRGINRSEYIRTLIERDMEKKR